MRLAISLAVVGSGRDAAALYERPEELRRALSWWRAKGAEGIVLYDVLPYFYRTPPERFAPLVQVIRSAGLEIAAFNGLRKSLWLPELRDADLRRCEHILEVC